MKEMGLGGKGVGERGGEEGINKMGEGGREREIIRGRGRGQVRGGGGLEGEIGGRGSWRREPRGRDS